MWCIVGDLISLPERWKILHGGLPQGGKIVSEYSNEWIDMRHDNALNTHVREAPLPR
jgi:hypothetical protein